MEKVAKDTLMFIAAKPGADAMNRYTTSKDPKDCVVAEAAYRIDRPEPGFRRADGSTRYR